MLRNWIYIATACIFVVILVIGGLRFDPAESVTNSVAVDDSLHTGADFEVDGYGIEADAFETSSGRIRRNQTFSDLLRDVGIEYPIVQSLIESSEGTFDLRGWQAGKKYTVYRKDNLPEYLVYEHNAVQFFIFDLVGGKVYRDSRPIRIKRHYAQGSITGSLYQTLLDQGVDPTLAYELSEVFAWQIDFYRIQQGDKYEVIYDERLVGDRTISVGQIHAARFTHMKDEYLAFHFDREGSVAYFDEEGNSLQKAFLKAPVKYSRISSRYTGRRFHPVLKTYRAHLGTDYAAPTGTPIRATGDGVIEEAGYRKYNGNWVKIRHNGTFSTGYLHMSRIARGIKKGVHVKQGDLIGYVGSTGLARGAHVCYRFWKNGSQVDPNREEFPSAHPVSEENTDLFADLRDDYLHQLDSLAIMDSVPVIVNSSIPAP
ncbi:MAG: peptidoglycan DD-metalloendopeptidase family protein [Rhodothermales bacterium]|nr:peptidoglycan DD-metalloendopeptidase family protein [Rhodothermales bacterium]